MDPKYAEAVDPVFVCVIDFLERIHAGETLIAAEVRSSIVAEIDAAEATLSSSQGWELAKYALACWVDSMMIHAHWDGADWFMNHKLEFGYFTTADAFTEFYNRASEADKLPKKDTLEVFYLCVVLGFEGMYSDPGSEMLAEQLGHAPSVEAWAKSTAEKLQLGQGRPPIQHNPTAIDIAQPLDGKQNLFLMSFFAAISILLAVVVYAFIFRQLEG